MLGAIVIGGMAPVPVLLGFGLFYVVTALVYRLPVPVQPMKAVVAVLLVGQVSQASVAAAGVMVGAVLLILGATGWIDHLKRLVPQSVLSGLQLGLGLALGLVAIRLIRDTPVFAMACLAGVGVLLLTRRLPTALVFLPLAILAGQVIGLEGLPVPDMALAPLAPALPEAEAWRVAATELALPQLALTLTNAVLLTALVAGDCHGPEAATRVTPRRLSLTSGLANLVLAPFGALPMCHGAGGMTAHWRFGARTGAAPLMLGVALLAVAVLPGSLALLAAIPPAALGALLFVAATDLALSKRLFDCRPSCRPVIAITAVATVLIGPFAGLVLGTIAELARKAILRRIVAGRNA